MIIPTPQRLRQQARRLDRRLARVEDVLSAMREGAALHQQYLNGKPDWRLTNGQRVDPDVVAVVITNPQVVAVGTALFDGFPSLAYRYALPPK